MNGHLVAADSTSEELLWVGAIADVIALIYMLTLFVVCYVICYVICKMVMMVMVVLTCCPNDTSVKSITCGSWQEVIWKDHYARPDLSADILQSHSYPRMFCVINLFSHSLLTQSYR